MNRKVETPLQAILAAPSPRAKPIFSLIESFAAVFMVLKLQNQVNPFYWPRIAPCRTHTNGPAYAPPPFVSHPEGPDTSFGLPFFESRSEEHTSELQSRPHLVCRLL